MATQLLRYAVAMPETEGPAAVLDVGPAVPQTLDFFGQFRCRIHFADLFDELEAVARSGDRVDFFDLLDFPAGTQFDLILFWDFLNYIDRPYFEAFNESLSRYIHEGTRAHAFIAFSPGVPLTGYQYGISRRDQLVVRSEQAEVPFPQARSDVGELLPQFRIDRGTLLQQNRQELLLAISRSRF